MRWEYLIEDESDSELDTRGSEGWEMFAVAPWSYRDERENETKSGRTLYYRREWIDPICSSVCTHQNKKIRCGLKVDHEGYHSNEGVTWNDFRR